MRLEKRRKEAAHNLLEYVLILGVVTAALFAMQVYFRRGVQGIIRRVAVDMGDQRDPVGGVAGGEITRQKEAKVKSLYGYANKGAYTILGGRTIYAKALGQGEINTTREGNTTTSETSYGILDEGKFHEAKDKLNLELQKQEMKGE